MIGHRFLKLDQSRRNELNGTEIRSPDPLAAWDCSGDRAS